jgi:hypothetical protein
MRTRRGLDNKGTCHMLVCADDVNFLSKNMDIITRNSEVLSAANWEVHLEVIAVKTSFVLRHGNRM